MDSLLRHLSRPIAAKGLTSVVSVVSAYLKLAASIQWGLGKRSKSVFLRTSLLSAILIWPGVALSQQTLVVDANNNRGWQVASWSNPIPSSLVGIADGLGGAASLDFSLAGNMGDILAVRLQPPNLPAGISTLNDLTSLSWRVNHSAELGYPKVSITVKTQPGAAKPTDGIYFRPTNQSLAPNTWQTVTVDFGADGSSFRNNGNLNEGNPTNMPLYDWIDKYGDREISTIQWTYGSSGSATGPYTSYIDQLEINGTTYDFEAGVPVGPDAPYDLIATPGDQTVSIAFTAGSDNGTPISDYEYRIDNGSWVSSGQTTSPIAINNGLTNGTDHTLTLRAVSAAGEGGEASVSFKPKAPTTDITLEVNANNLRGFHLAHFSSDYVKERNNTGIADNAGGSASLNAGLSGQGGDRWGLFISPGDVAQRVITRLYDLESLSFRVWTDGERNYPRLGFRMKRQTAVADVTWEQLNVNMGEAPDVSPGGWQTFTVDFDSTIFSNADNTAANGEEPSGKFSRTLNDWIRLYGDREIAIFRWQTGNGRESIRTTQETYIDYVEINGVTYDFEAVPLIAPDAPAITATPGDRSAEVSFSPANDNGSAITDYEYRVGSENWVSAGTSSPITINDLENGKTVEIWLRAINAAGPGGESFVDVTPGGLPAPPTNLAATAGNAEAIITFDAYGTGNGREITNYWVSTGGEFSPLNPADNASPIVVTGLTNGQAVDISLKTETVLGLSTASAVVPVTPSSGAAPPKAPTITGITPGDQSVSVAFTPGADNGSAITNYEYSLNGADWTARSPASTSSPLTLDGLINGQTYMISLRAVNDEGAGADSGIQYFKLPLLETIIETPSGASLELDVNVQAGSTCGIDANSVALVEVPEMGDNVTSAYPNMLDFTLVNCDEGESVEVEITLSQDPPTNGIPYKYTNGRWSAIPSATLANRVMRYTLQDGGPLDESPLAGTIEDPAAIAVPSGKPDAPYDLTAAPGIGSATISFTAGSDYGYEITNYLYSTDGVDYAPLNPPDAASPVTITGLTSGEGVSITLKAQNSKGDSPASEAVVVIPRAAPMPVPLPLWLLAALMGAVGWLGFRRLRLA